jgi:uncharacterized membrane protein
MSGLLITLVVLSTLGSGLIAGLFFAFSVSVMSALGRLPAEHGVAAMQSINIVIINPMFLGVFFGTAALCLVVGFLALPRMGEPAFAFAIAGGLLYLAGSIGVTMALNVPLNNALAAVAPSSPEAAEVWARYLKDWTLWNHVRTIASLAASASFIAALTIR